MSTSAHRDQAVANPQGDVKSQGVANPGRFRTNQPGTHTLAVHRLDRYPTPRIAVENLLDTESDTLNTMARVWDPAAGEGNIVAVLRENGIPTIASDIERQAGFDLHFVGDFLKQDHAPNGCRCIVAQPPNKLAAQFAEHLAPDVYLLLRLNFLESVSRTELLEHSGLRRVLVFRRRLPRMHKFGYEGPKANSSLAFSWLCWRAGYQGRAILARI
jgi:hypothetical protein